MRYTDGVQDSYGPAAVCRRGHVHSSDLRLSAPGKGQQCQDCGAPILTACPACGARILGELFVAGVITVSSWTPADFCDQCGGPMPWASWKARVWHVANVAAKNVASAKTQLQLDGIFEDLANGGLDLDLAEETAVWRSVLDTAPALRDNRDLLRTVMSDGAVANLLGRDS